MALNFIQSGYDLEIDTTSSETPPQFTRGGLVSVELTDDTFDGLDKLALLFAPDDGRKHTPAVVELSKTDSNGMHYAGAFTRASMLHDGPVLVALAGTTSTQTITSNAYQIRVGKSLDPEAGMLADPATLADVVAAAVDSWLQANGIPTDSTLSVVGKPADAAAVGGALSQLTEEIDTKTSDLKSDLSQLSEEKVDKIGLSLGVWTDGKAYIFIDGKPYGLGIELSGAGDTPVIPEVEVTFFDVNWSNYAITCGQNTNNYNAWAPNNLQYDSVNDAFVFLQCHANRHLNHTLTTWTLSRIYPDEPWKTEDLGLPEANKLGALWVENGTWYVLPMNDTTAYKSNNMGVTWEQFTINLSAPLWGIYKCDGVYYSGDDTNTDTYYTSTDLVTWDTHTFGFSDSYSALMEASFCWYKDYVWAFLRTNDATLGHPVILKSADGLSWELVSDSMLHTYRSMVNCYPYQDYIILADIDRDNGILYYSRFDGETVETLNEWNVGDKGDDFHCPCICSDGKNTIIIEFMLHSWVNTGSFSDAAQYYCENMMLIGKTDSLKLHSLTIEDIPFTNAKDFVETYCDVYPPEAVDNFTYSTNRIATTEAGYMAAVVMKEPNLFSKHAYQSPEYFYRGNVVSSLYNSENLSRFGTDVNAVNNNEKFYALIEIEDKRYIYQYNTDATLPSIQLRTVEKELGFKPYNDNYPQVSGVLEETANLGFTKQIPVHSGNGVYSNIYPHSKVTFVKAGS